VAQFHQPAENLLVLVNRFDCASSPAIHWGEEKNMTSAVVGALIFLSIVILLAHALDMFRSS
jgi:hypothetical protein